jgi:PAS domain S-box-containing protein
MASRTITFRFPEEVIAAIEARAKAAGSNRTAVLMQALTLAYGIPSSNKSTPPSAANIQQQLCDFEQQVMTLLEDLTKAVHDVKERPFPDLGTSIFQSELPVIMDCSLEQSQFVAQLEHKARMLDQILAATPDLVFVQDRMGRFTYINPVTARVLGFKQSFFLGKTVQELGIPEELFPLFSINREVVFRTGRPVSGEVSIPTVHEIRDYEYIISPIPGTEGTIDTVVCTARDITERKRAEIALRESEEEYRNLFELANDSILIIEASTGQILNANRNAARRLGYTRRELLQLSLCQIESPTIDSAEQQEIAAKLQSFGNVIYEHTFRRKDGAEIPVEVSSRLIEYGDRLAYQSFFRDIAERKQTEARMRLIESAFFNANDALVITELEPIHEPKIVQVNQQFTTMTGYRAEEVLNRSLSLLYGVDTDRTQIAHMQAAMAQRQPLRIELLTYRKDGSEFWIEQTIAPITNEAGTQTHWILIQREID